MKKNYQSFEKCIICETTNQRCYHHLKARQRKKPIDEKWNLISCCVNHHNFFHSLGLNKMSEKYPQVKKWLIENDWYFDGFKWRH